MAVSPSSSVQRARQELAARLREVRLDAGLTGRALAAAAGWHPAKVSRIENARQALTDADVRAWCRVCGVDEQAADLIAASRAADSMYLAWRRQNIAGMRRDQENRIPLYERTNLHRVYCSTVLPGFCQTPGYAAALLSEITRFQGTPDDVADAVAARMRRNRLLTTPGHEFTMIIEESVLRYQIGDAATMAGQLAHLLDVAALPAVSLGIIPFTAKHRPMWTLEAFNLFDEERVHVELLAAGDSDRARRGPAVCPRLRRAGRPGGDRQRGPAPDPRRDQGHRITAAQFGAISLHWPGVAGAECEHDFAQLPVR